MNRDALRGRIEVAASGLLGLALAGCLALRWLEPGLMEWAANGASALWACFALSLLLQRAEIRAWSRAMPPMAQLLLPVIVVLLAMGQVVGDSEKTHPLAHWHMFSSANPKHRYSFNELVADTRAGATIRLIPGRVFPSVGRHLLFSRLHGVLAPLPVPPTSRRLSPLQAQRIEATFAAFAGRYNRLHPDDPLVRIRAQRTWVSFDDTGPTGPRRTVVLLEREVGAR